VWIVSGRKRGSRSVNAHVRTASPRTTAGRTASRCASVPSLAIVSAATTVLWSGSGATARPTSSKIRPRYSRGRSWPPYFSGRAIPCQPSSAVFRHRAGGYPLGAISISRTRVVEHSASKNSRALSRTIFSSSVSSTSMIGPLFVQRREVSGFPALRGRPSLLTRSLCPAPRGQAETATRDLVSHDLDAAVVDPGLERAHQVVREDALLDGVGRAVQQLAVRAQHLGDSLRRPDPVLRRPHFLGRSLVREVAAVLDDGHAPHGHEPAHLGLDPELRDLVPDRRVVRRGVAVEPVRLDPVDDVLVAAHGAERARRADPVEVQAHGPDAPPRVLLAEQ